VRHGGKKCIDPVVDILAVAIVLHGKKDYVKKNTTHNIQRHVTRYLQSTPGELHLPKQACLMKKKLMALLLTILTP